MNRKNLKAKARSIAAKSAAVVSGTLAAAGSAMAQTTTTLSSGLSDAVTEYKPELLVIGGIVLGICGVVFLVKKAQRTSGG